MMKNFKIVVEYDGTNFAGWQVQKNGITVQGELQKAISVILNQQVKVIGSGRTDSGVHALGQVANFHANTNISSDNLLKGVNSIIKTPIVIKSCNIVSSDFHARYSSLSKEYHYYILNSTIPWVLGKDYIWYIKAPLNIDIMKQCCEMLTGEHDFKSFEASGSPRSHTIRTIYSADIDYIGNIAISPFQTSSDILALYPHRLPFIGRSMEKIVLFKIEGNGFLRFMVRNIVGTLVMAGLSKITPNDFRYILEVKNRDLAGATAPARGLFLTSVNYD
ncbi:MAG: tRNA pseudouridine(38-40) synthase TruA [Desulfamplus sp.]|nr:tRNA pseudouridine(38-40) synthase TruA [Desulfamplus sp.]